MPVVGEPLGPPDVYGQDRVFVAIGEHDGLDALENAGHPVARLRFDGREQIGGEFFRWEMATAVAGYVLGINPFDQPNVDEAKDATKEILASGPGRGPGFDDLGALLKEVTEGDYVAIMAYLDRTSKPRKRSNASAWRSATAPRWRPRSGSARGSCTRPGSSTRAGPTTACSSRSWTTAPVDLPIPGQPYTFGTLIDAQALGDLRSLRAHGRRVARVTFDRLMEVL